MQADWSDDELVSLFDRVDNAGRWGPDDELGTLNYITPVERRAAATLVRTGETMSLSLPLTGGQVEHQLRYHHDPGHPLRPPPSAGEHLSLDVHQPGLTHLDCVSHIGSHDGRVYTGRSFDAVATDAGLSHGSIYAQRAGILSRGVLLDVAAACERDWLEPMHPISVAELEAAETVGNVRASRGDVVVVRSGSDARQVALGPTPFSPGPAPEAIEWFHRREIAVYTGDAPERLTPAGARILGLLPPGIPEPGPTRFPLPLHQIAIPAMGLVLLDHSFVEGLAQRCRQLGRYEFMFVAAPLALPGGTGSPVNPIAVF